MAVRGGVVADDGFEWVNRAADCRGGVPSEFGKAVARFMAGQSVVVIAEADNGSASQLVGLLPEGSLFARVDCAPVASGEPVPVCEFDAQEAILTNPMVLDDIVYVPTRGQNIWTLPTGSCSGTVPDRLPFYVTETPVDVAPAIVGDIMYLADGRFLYAKNLKTNDDHWEPGKVSGDSAISAAPVKCRRHRVLRR